MTRTTIRLVLLALTLTLSVLLVQGMWAVHPHGDGVEGMPTIVDLQLSFAEDEFRHVFDLWSGAPCVSDRLASAECYVPASVETYPEGIATFKRNLLLLDYAFPILYASLFFNLITWLWAPRPAVVRWLGVGAGVMALADWVENTLHLWVLRGIDRFDQLPDADLPEAGIWLASSFALIKWVLILGAFGALVVGFARTGWRRLSRAA